MSADPITNLWNKILLQPPGFLARFLRNVALRSILLRVKNGDPAAAAGLAKYLTLSPDSPHRAEAAGGLAQITSQPAVNAAWQVAAELTAPSPILVDALRNLNKPAAVPPAVRAYSLLVLNRPEMLADAVYKAAEAVIARLTDPDPAIAAAAARAVQAFRSPAALDAVAADWCATRRPILAERLASAGHVPENPPSARVLTALLTNRLELITRGSTALLPDLIAALADRDAVIADRARFCLLNLNSAEQIDALSATWDQTASPALAQIIARAGYVARQPPRLRLRTALLGGRVDFAARCSPDQLSDLLALCADPHTEVNAAANAAVRQLQEPATREACCRLAIEQDDSLARQVAIQAGYLPDAPEQRALYLYLTDQWPQYNALDFDRQLLQMVYETAPAELRQRISRRVQSGGHAEDLAILSSGSRTASARMNAAEYATLARLQLQHGEYERLWELAFQTPLAVSVEILQSLKAAGWQPASLDDAALFDRLLQLASAPLMLKQEDQLQALPPVQARALLHVSGRVNDVAFSPQSPGIAIVTGSRRLVRWNYQKAAVESVVGGFNHSLGEVCYTPTGQLFCAERTLKSEQCALYAVPDGRPEKLGAHQNSITALEAAGDQHVVSAGRDGQVILWNSATRQIAARRTIKGDWPTALCLSSASRRLITAHDRPYPQLMRLPGLNDEEVVFTTSGQVRPQVSPAKSAAYAPDGSAFFIGQHNGQVVRFDHLAQNSLKIRRTLLGSHPSRVEGVAFIPHPDRLVTASADGELRFWDWPQGQLLGRITAPEGALNSLHISPDGSFMATGSSDSSMRLWDLRAPRLAEMLQKPLASLVPGDMSLIAAYYAEPTLPQALRASLSLMYALLEHRFRFDVELGELADIQPGEFDILIDSN